jgi:GNAT superfamily N-acetyltransferase
VQELLVTRLPFQKSLYPNDKGLDFIEDMQDKQASLGVLGQTLLVMAKVVLLVAVHRPYQLQKVIQVFTLTVIMTVEIRTPKKILTMKSPVRKTKVVAGMADKSINLAQEFLYNVELECQSLIEMHWDEIALNQEKIKLNPDWEAYHNLEVQDKLKIFTAREDGLLVGYFVVIVATNIHYKDHLFASNDIIYLHPDYRKGMTGVKLIKFAEKCLSEDGVSVMTINTKIHKPFDLILGTTRVQMY